MPFVIDPFTLGLLTVLVSCCIGAFVVGLLISAIAIDLCNWVWRITILPVFLWVAEVRLAVWRLVAMFLRGIYEMIRIILKTVFDFIAQVVGLFSAVIFTAVNIAWGSIAAVSRTLLGFCRRRV